jgi:hypothetical protein
MLMVWYILSHRRASRFDLGLVVAGHNKLCFFAEHAEHEEPCNAQKDKSKRALERALMAGI